MDKAHPNVFLKYGSLRRIWFVWCRLWDSLDTLTYMRKHAVEIKDQSFKHTVCMKRNMLRACGVMGISLMAHWDVWVSSPLAGIDLIDADTYFGTPFLRMSRMCGWLPLRLEREEKSYKSWSIMINEPGTMRLLQQNSCAKDERRGQETTKTEYHNEHCCRSYLCWMCKSACCLVASQLALFACVFLLAAYFEQTAPCWLLGTRRANIMAM